MRSYFLQQRQKRWIKNGQDKYFL